MQDKWAKRLEVLSGHVVRNQCGVEANACAGRNVLDEFRQEGVQVVGSIKNKKVLHTLSLWHESVSKGMGGNAEGMETVLDSILDENIVFLAPTYLKARRNKAFTIMALLGVTKAFKGFKYTRIFVGDEGFALEFECNIGSEDGLFMRGIDLMKVNESGKITSFEVMARPPKAVLQLLELQTNFLRAAGMVPPAKRG
mmetsp:Transcript_3542/g.5131  ORF Transcript_3542/g.5131 Transcript_3542/m.5131 type:complete len:197 (-) Transcript_3542:40-630(-)|eukprot:CAMPEP_0203798482 /NCGR_PEP_ID=MMETSP0100_2-20121128/9305_1 /ASSEMBLY_ACC=CAM_ASM_000210 /TAXON_ID=96639 /ORGANISM=" , Strain NY0313808BC1" /LENGTH=196 /DNA_ID=CAMNT_0050704097 /DNA_START=136 /DNA_END=726 /DNA_ORIENTATION=-